MEKDGKLTNDAVLRSFLGIKSSDRQNVDIQIVDIKM
jgi:hypothetical protein